MTNSENNYIGYLCNLNRGKLTQFEVKNDWLLIENDHSFWPNILVSKNFSTKLSDLINENFQSISNKMLVVNESQANLSLQQLKLEGVFYLESWQGMELNIAKYKDLNQKICNLDIGILNIENVLEYERLISSTLFNKKVVNGIVEIHDTSKFTLYQMTYKEQIIGSAILYNDGLGEVGLYHFSISEEYRGRGFARAFLNQLIINLKQQGENRLILQSTSMAEKLYSKFGFMALNKMHIYFKI